MNVTYYQGETALQAGVAGYAGQAPVPGTMDILNETFTSLCHAADLAEQISNRVRGFVPRVVEKGLPPNADRPEQCPNIRDMAQMMMERASGLCAELQSIQATL